MRFYYARDCRPDTVSNYIMSKTALVKDVEDDEIHWGALVDQELEDWFFELFFPEEYWLKPGEGPRTLAVDYIEGSIRITSVVY